MKCVGKLNRAETDTHGKLHGAFYTAKDAPERITGGRGKTVTGGTLTLSATHSQAISDLPRGKNWQKGGERIPEINSLLPRFYSLNKSAKESEKGTRRAFNLASLNQLTDYSKITQRKQLAIS